MLVMLLFANVMQGLMTYFVQQEGGFATCAALFSFFGAPGAPAGAPPAPDGPAAP